MEGYYDSIHKDGSKCRERDGSIQRLRQGDQWKTGQVGGLMLSSKLLRLGEGVIEKSFDFPL